MAGALGLKNLKSSRLRTCQAQAPASSLANTAFDIKCQFYHDQRWQRLSFGILTLEHPSSSMSWVGSGRVLGPFVAVQLK